METMHYEIDIEFRGIPATEEMAVAVTDRLEEIDGVMSTDIMASRRGPDEPELDVYFMTEELDFSAAFRLAGKAAVEALDASSAADKTIVFPEIQRISLAESVDRELQPA